MKHLELTYFGVLQEIKNSAKEHIEFQGESVQELISHLSSGNKEFTGNVQCVAVNNTIVEFDFKLNENDKVAFMPQFSGG